MNNLPPPKIRWDSVRSLGSEPIFSIYRDTHKYTFFGYVRKSKTLLFKTSSYEEVKKVFYALGGDD